MSTIEGNRPATLPPLVAGQRLDRPTFHARYEAMPPGTRAELIGGVVHMPSPLSYDHGEMTPNVSTWLNLYRRRIPGIGVANDASTLLGEEGEPQPDCLLRLLPEFGGLSRVNAEGYLAGAPELIVEIARSSRRIDLGGKLRDYERAGVQEYLVVALSPDEIHWHVRREGRLVAMPPGVDGIYRSAVFPGLWLEANALFAGDLDGVLATLDRGLATPEHAAFVARLAAWLAAP